MLLTEWWRISLALWKCPWVCGEFPDNGRDYLIPMAIEEPSVIAAASNSAKMAREAGLHHQQHRSCDDGPDTGCRDKRPKWREVEHTEKKEEIIRRANEVDPILVKFGGRKGC